MQEEQSQIDYTKGFNEGYLVSKNLPELSDKIASAIGDSDRGQGFRDGRKELLQERLKEKTPEWASKSRDISLEPGKSLDKSDKERE